MHKQKFRINFPPVKYLPTVMLLGALLILIAAPAYSAQVTLNPLSDNTIYQGTDATQADPNFEDNSCGAGTNLFAGQTNNGLLRRALLRFDIAGQIPAGSTINSATLTVTVNRAGGNVPQTMTLRPVTQDWGEGMANCDAVRGGGQGIDADPGDATWLDSHFQQTAWSSAGGDFGAISASALVDDGNGAQGIWDSSSAGNGAMVTDLQNWLDIPGTNNGWEIVGLEGAGQSTRRFSSREGSNVPTLTIDFTPTGDVFACCFQDGACTVTDTASCTAQGGIPDSSDSCSPNPCPQPTGACCNRDESCSELARDVCVADGGTFQGEASTCGDNSVDCGLTPFVDALPIPPVLVPTGVTPEGVAQYTVDIEDVSQELHSELPNTDVWTYNGSYPGFTIEARSGEPVEVTYNNNLPSSGGRGGHIFEVDECAHGPNYWGSASRISTHLHGGHLPAEDDGQPEKTILPGQSQVLNYTNNQEPATLWYHDHALGITRLNVYAGMAGFYLIRDDFEDALGLPSGEYEIPIVIQDREFNPDGSFFYPPAITNAFFGDKILANGKVWPFLNVKQGKYRFRFLNGSQARSYSLRLENLANPSQVIPFTLIGTDTGLTSAPIPLDTIGDNTTTGIAPAERLDVIVDFSSFPAGTEIVLRNDDLATPLLTNVMKFVVQGQTGFTGPIPAELRPVTPIPEADATVTRRFNLVRINDPGTACGFEWLIQSLGTSGEVVGEQWDDVTDMPQLGTTEIWQFENDTNIMHPMHIHLVRFQVLDREPFGGGTAMQLDPWEINTWKDTVKVPPHTQVRVIARFEDYPGRFPYHCHILDHEDHEMMRQFRTTNDPANCNNNGTCDYGEDTVSCPNDCDAVNGARCGNGLCEAGDGENCATCAADCAGKQKGSSSKQFCCGFDDGNVTNPLGCGSNADGSESCVDASNGRACRATPAPLAQCGDGLCEGAETASNCPADCAPPPPACNPTEPGQELSCNDGQDNDCDGLIDAADPDCAACQPTGVSETICNGVDDDCDILIDEDYASSPTSCGVGVCAATGNTTCNGGVEGDTCTPGSPTEPGTETSCNDSLDNDCDGLTDANDPDCAVCQPTGVSETLCNGVDDDCDTLIDEDYASSPTSCGVGACASTGNTTCSGGVEGDSCTPGTPGVEGPAGNATCGDHIDNDCDGLTDANDPDCQGGGVVCSDFTNKTQCRNEPTCQWKKNACTTR